MPSTSVTFVGFAVLAAGAAARGAAAGRDFDDADGVGACAAATSGSSAIRSAGRIRIAELSQGWASRCPGFAGWCTFA
jgi:hypothetical protein